MFMGEYHPMLDDKSRTAIPARLRKAFGDSAVINRLIITHGFDKCIMAFREEDWKDFVENRLVRLSQAEPLNRQRLRFLLGGACDCDLDKQGRIVIPSYLLEYAEIKRTLPYWDCMTGLKYGQARCTTGTGPTAIRSTLLPLISVFKFYYGEC